MRLKSIVLDTEETTENPNDSIEIRLEKTWTTDGTRIYLSAVLKLWDGHLNRNSERILHQTWIWAFATEIRTAIESVLRAPIGTIPRRYGDRDVSLIAEQINRLR
jgi:hypothetical protein